MMLLSIGVRLMVLSLIHQSVGPIVFAPDANVYEQVGEELLQSWQGLRAAPEKAAGTQAGYYAVNALSTLVFGRGGGAPAAMNILLATWLALPVYYLTLAVVRDKHAVARWATVMALFFPSMILWSVLNIREAPTIFTLVSATCFFARFQRTPSARDLIGAALSLLGLLLKPTLERVQYLRQDLAYGANSAYGGEADVSTVRGALTFIPVGLTYFLLAPFPWSATSVLQQVTLPESILWYALFVCVLRGGWLALRHDPRAYTVLVAVLGVVTFSYALIEANVGTAYRHRAQVLPLFFVLAAVGLRDAWGSWMERRIAARATRGRAVASIRPGAGAAAIERGLRRR
jgi:hypothetical protein